MISDPILINIRLFFHWGIDIWEEKSFCSLVHVVKEMITHSNLIIIIIAIATPKIKIIYPCIWIKNIYNVYSFLSFKHISAYKFTKWKIKIVLLFCVVLNAEQFRKGHSSVNNAQLRLRENLILTSIWEHIPANGHLSVMCVSNDSHRSRRLTFTKLYILVNFSLYL